jgi:hypothetical protein
LRPPLDARARFAIERFHFRTAIKELEREIRRPESADQRREIPQAKRARRTQGAGKPAGPGEADPRPRGGGETLFPVLQPRRVGP